MRVGYKMRKFRVYIDFESYVVDVEVEDIADAYNKAFDEMIKTKWETSICSHDILEDT